ncbi:MAG: hypothetical protein QF692_01745 [Alphaproteobacteria bacterium]|nr:hypothetical protein [Alphaproteobacteria bacterium]
MSKGKRDIEDVLSEIDSLVESIHEEDKSIEYDRLARAIIIAHYTSFLAIVWKSFETTGTVPLSGKLALVIFAFGGFLAAIRFLISVCTSEKIDEYKRLIEIEQEFGDELQEHDPEGYKQFSLLNKGMAWAFNKSQTSETPGFVFPIINFLLDATALTISFILLLLGLFILGLGVLF